MDLRFAIYKILTLVEMRPLRATLLRQCSIYNSQQVENILQFVTRSQQLSSHYRLL